MGRARVRSPFLVLFDAHPARVKGLLDNTKGTIVSGGETDPSITYRPYYNR